jgi:hypothetical protein
MLPIGIDISKASFDVAFLDDDKYQNKKFNVLISSSTSCACLSIALNIVLIDLLVDLLRLPYQLHIQLFQPALEVWIDHTAKLDRFFTGSYKLHGWSAL